MKLSKLFVIALLAGTLALIGCGSDTTTPDNGGGGTNGTPTGNCDYGDCANEGTERDACELAVGVCEATLAGEPLEICIEASNTDACGAR